MHRCRRVHAAPVGAAISALLCAGVLHGVPLPAGPYDEPWRPQFHFTPAANFMNDPNGAVYFDGEYHLFYQHNPHGTVWGHMSWGHAVSRDLVSWTHLPVALPEYGEWMVFSGSAVVDADNSSGLCAESGAREACLVAIYTAHSGGRKRQTQNLAYSRDHGRTWQRYTGNPVLDLEMEHFRDPKVIRDVRSGRWVMAVALPKEHRIRFYGSTDLRRWERLSDFGPAGAISGDYECPDLLHLPVENAPGEKRWVLVVSLNPGAPLGGSAVQYFVGEFDGMRFVPDEPVPPTRWADFGKDFYAAQSWFNLPPEHERPVWIGWISNWEYANTEPTEVWRGAQSVARSLALRRGPRGWQLVQQPVAALASLREPLYAGGDSPIAADATVGLERVEGDALDLEVVLEPAAAREIGVLVRRGPGEETAIGYDAQKQAIYVDRTRSGRIDFDKRFAGRHLAPAALDAQGRLTLRIIVDRSSVEVFGDGGVAVITDRVYPSPQSRGIALFARGGAGRLVELKAWRLRSTWTSTTPPSGAVR